MDEIQYESIGWEEVKVQTQELKPHDKWQPKDHKPGDAITGVLIDKKDWTDPAGKIKKYYLVEDVPEHVFIVWGSSLLDKLMVNVPVGVVVRIEYGGKKPVKGSKGLRTFHAWNVYYKKSS